MDVREMVRDRCKFDACHCGHDMHGSDHCPACGCEEFESTCDHVADPETCTCPYHS